MPRRTLGHVVGRRQIFTVFYPRKRSAEVFTNTVYTPVHSDGAPDALGD